MRLTLQEKILVQQLVQYDIWHYQDALKKANQDMKFCEIEKEQTIIDRIKEYETSIKVRTKIYDKIQKDF
jgi:hypothetical protein